ncbi:MAG: hypothetical protein AAF658_00700, partial [Myxococcota bacterium]
MNGWLRPAVLCLWVSVVLPACESDTVRDVRIDLSLRGSCGFASQNYNISCVSSIEVRVLGNNGALLAEQCTTVSGVYEDLGDLVSDAPRSLLDDLPAVSGVVVELRGYVTPDRDGCSDLEERDLVFWGESAPVDLASSMTATLLVQIECRPGCDCADFGRPECPVALEPGACAPVSTVLCRRPCSDASI